MSLIRKIEVSGFRGVPTRLTVSFPAGTAGSLILYGPNGTGKSSLTDAWEWLTTGKIQHLAREGAEEGSYPNLTAKPGTTYVEVEMAEPELGTIRLTFDNKRVTIPKSLGNVAQLRTRVAHPCHVRHADLTRFVLLKKAERYDVLATLMGFVPQMEYQKALRRVSERLAQDLLDQRNLYQDVQRRFKAHFENQPGESFPPDELMARRCVAHGIDCDGTPTSVAQANVRLKQLVIQDPNAKRLAALKTVRGSIGAFSPATCVAAKVKVLREAISALRASQAIEREKMLRIPFLESAEKLLGAIPATGRCPLCSAVFNGDLKQHVSAELQTLQRLNALVARVNAARQNLTTALIDHTEENPARVPEGFTPSADLKAALDTLTQKVKAWRNSLDGTKALLTFDTSALSLELVQALTTIEAQTQQCHDAMLVAKKAVLELLDQQSDALEKDPKRKKLVNDSEYVAAGLKLQGEIAASLEKGRCIKTINDRFTALVNRYVEAALKDVTGRFDQISEKVTTFFTLLEAGTPGIGAPKLKLDTTQDRSVVLEVEFQGTRVSPAYRYLSESQLNSFGLAVALASATHFNAKFPFLILDDVVNSCDAYKRSQLIEILKDHLGHVQVLLLTHDKLWRDLLHKRLPNWGRLDFQRYEIGVGPICAPGKNTYDLIQEDVARDDAPTASTRLARYMEDAAQEIAEAIQVDVKFNRRGEYTLDPLLTAIRVRLEKKLGANHPATQQVVRITQDNAYRNWGVHCKNGGTPITTHEVNTVVTNWKSFESTMSCPSCNKVVAFAEPGFRCSCGSTCLVKAAEARSA